MLYLKFYVIKLRNHHNSLGFKKVFSHKIQQKFNLEIRVSYCLKTGNLRVILINVYIWLKIQRINIMLFI